MRRRFGLAGFIVIIQIVLLLAHAFLYKTWIYFVAPSGPQMVWGLRAGIAVLSVSFLAASLLAFRSQNIVVRWFYTVAAVWLGFANFLFMAACSSWLIYGATRVFGVSIGKGLLAAATFGVAALVGVYSVVNAAWTRVKRVSIQLPNLPAAWKGRQIVLVSDLHLGHVRHLRFARRIVRMIAKLPADAVLIAGDMYDGTKADIHRLAQPWKELSVPHGIYFIAGNHEEFGDHTKYLNGVASAGIRVLNNERVVVNGLQIVGVHYRDATDAEHFRKTLRNTGVNRESPSVLLTHAPDRLEVAEEEGISLQLSGHTHLGQVFPFTKIVRRIYGPFAYGLNRLGAMQVYTSSGAGTWGPPLRVGSEPEIVIIKFE
jgi:hypothetical protein